MPTVTDNSSTPLYLSGKVVKGFQRGSKELGFPTANLDFVSDNAKEIKSKLTQGVYYGYARVGGGEIYPMAMSIGDNPHYGNKEVTVEIHILHPYEKDFYEQTVTGIAVGYIRAMTPFKSLDDLIAAIQNDCDIARNSLAAGTDAYKSFGEHPFLHRPAVESAPASSLVLL